MAGDYLAVVSTRTLVIADLPTIRPEQSEEHD